MILHATALLDYTGHYIMTRFLGLTRAAAGTAAAKPSATHKAIIRDAIVGSRRMTLPRVQRGR